MRKIVFVLALAIGLGGCSGDSIFRGGTSLTAPITNPVGRRELAVVENSYAIALNAAITYRRFCYSKPLAQLPAACKNRREVVLKLQAADKKARGALLAARNFVRNNPTISAVSAISAAKAAIADFRSVVPAGV